MTGGSIYPRWRFPWDSEWLDLSVIASMSGTFPSGWKETFLLFFSLQRLLYFMQRGKVMRLSACSHILSAMRLLFLFSVCWMLGRIRSLTSIPVPAFQVLCVVFSPHLLSQFLKLKPFSMYWTSSALMPVRLHMSHKPKSNLFYNIHRRPGVGLISWNKIWPILKYKRFMKNVGLHGSPLRLNEQKMQEHRCLCSCHSKDILI